ncbi:rhomboid family intramembrane serine protease [Pediococcus argentinicus]|uniref:Membrane-associated serine protease n=1 Tax=Pediococcus argentinicus TaxID=480391 RepID=A0A0R2NLA0_9LACO|nr:rhomboid family intramembrane serine protease [Pediococcus argentinicus]KRO25387.1 membrane-associated serine protease [Pediococcus argentinicus]NKZ22305.1 rhomboid family intramembrane serine protease [Pediococcus argentinicus]GEP19330.1 rhomboid family intramembrane serine protease [Pediococcus argentinicus]
MKNRINELQSQPYVTVGLVLINVIVFVLMFFSGGSSNINVLINFGGLIPAVVKSGSGYDTLITSLFLHSGIEHITLNMVMLYFIGRILERVIGHFKFFIIYMLSGIFGNLISIQLSNPNTVSIGASGAIFGIIGIWLMLAEQYPNQPLFRGMGQQMLLFIGLGLVGSFFGTGIDIFAHIGGLIGGFLLSYAIGFPKFGKVSNWKRITSVLVLIIISGWTLI